jgi:hypothetical protein
MKVSRQFVVWVLLVWALSETGCKQKTVQTVPSHGQAPTIAVALPPKIPEAPTPTPSTPPKQEQPELPPTKQKTSPKRSRKKPPAQNPALTQPAEAAPSGDTGAGSTAPAPGGSTTVATNRPPAPGGEAPVDVAIAPQVSNEQANHQKDTATQMLDATEKNLKSLKPDLGKDQQAMVNQIRSYMSQSKKALSENDFERAANLATKARLLSDALVQK